MTVLLHSHKSPDLIDYALTSIDSLELKGDEDAKAINTALDLHRVFLMLGKTAEQLAGTSSDAAFYKRWFRAELDNAAAYFVTVTKITAVKAP